MRAKAWAFLIGMVLVGTWADASKADFPAHPLLLFTGGDLPAIRARVEQPPYAAAWQAQLAKARGLLRSAEVVDPAAPRDWGQDNPRRAMMLIGHRIGRGLSTWMETLGIAYHITGDEAFADKAAALLVTAARRFPVNQEWMKRGFAGGRGDFMRGLALGHDLVNDRLSPEDLALLRLVADGYLANFLAEAQEPKTWWYGVHNYNGVCGGAAGLLAMTLRASHPDVPAERVDDCIAVLRRWFDTAFDEQGAYCEGVGYAHYGLSNALLFARALRRQGGPDLFDHPRLRRVPQFFAMSLLPGETVMDARNDSNYAPANIESLLLAEANKDGLARWLYDLRGGPMAPWDVLIDPQTPPVGPRDAGLPSSLHFEGRGLCVWRTGWDVDDVMFSIEAGRFYPVTHNQGDKGHFTFYGYGHRWAVDAGYGNDRSRPLSRDHTLAHSCVLIDGQGQALSGSGLGTDGRILRFGGEGACGYALADCTPAYNANSRGQPGPGVERALRHALFPWPSRGVPPYAVLLDDIGTAQRPREYAWQMVTWPDMLITPRDTGFVVEPRTTLSQAYLTTPADAEGAGRCTWIFTVPAAGAYRVWARVAAGGTKPGGSDSFRVHVGNQPRVEWHMPDRRTWVWGTVSHGVNAEPRVFDLPAGPCEVTFATREAEARVDVVALVPVAADAPADDRLPALLGRASEARVQSPMVRRDDPVAARMVVCLSAASPPGFAVDRYEPDDGRQPAFFPRMRAVVTHVAPRFVAVLAPLPGGVREPAITVNRTAAATTIEVNWATAQDTVHWPHDEQGQVVFERRSQIERNQP
jgi:hypothetical protein